MITKFEHFLELPEIVWDYYLILQDSYARHFIDKDIKTILNIKDVIIKKAVNEITVENNQGEFSLICSLPQKVKVRRVENEQFANPSILNFGQYCNNEILISKSALELFDRIEGKYHLQNLFAGSCSMKDLIYAHEYFHYWYDNCNTVKMQNFRKIIKVGPFSKTVTPECAEELVAFSFSKIVTKLSCHPYLIQIILLAEIQEFNEYELLDTLKGIKNI